MVSLLLMAARARMNHISVAPALDFVDYVDTLSPVAHWRMGDAIGSTALVDRIAAAAASLTGTAGTGYTLGQTGMVRDDADTAVKFSGGYAASAAGQKWSLGTGDFSAFVLLRTTASGGYPTVPFAIRSSGTFDVLFLFQVNQTGAGMLSIAGWNGSKMITQIGTQAINDGKPHAIGTTYDAATNTCRGYVDGALGATFQYSTAQSRPTGAAMSVRFANNFASQPFNGTLDEAVLFDHKLTDADMATLASYVATS